MEKCFDCPRNCGIDRSCGFGFCHEGAKIRVAKIIENFMWEEPCISGEKGALAIFFSGCNLKCSFCQNRDISHIGKGDEFTPREFRDLILSYDLSRFSSIDLVTPTHFSTLLIEALAGLSLPIPIVWNSSGYEKADMIEKLSGVVDVFLPDFKYCDDALALSLSRAGDYFEVASTAVCKMREIKSDNIIENGVLQSGVLIRHLVLPGHTADSVAVLDFIKAKIQKPVVSIMSQFIPLGGAIERRLYPLEYKAVLAHAEKLGLSEGYIQDFSSADEGFVPEF